MSDFMGFLAAVVITVLVVLFLGFGINNTINNKEKCEAKGGIYSEARFGWNCLKKDSVIKL